MMSRRTLCVALFVAVLACLLRVGPGEAQQASKLKMGYSVISGTTLPLWLGKDSGLFEKYGLDVELIYHGGATKAVTAVISGDTPITQSAGTGSILARLSGSDTMIFATLVNVISVSLMVHPGIHEPKDLQGKILGVTRYGSLTDFGTRSQLQAWGMDPNRDVKIIQMGGVPESLAALRNGAIQGTALTAPDLSVAKKLGFVELADLSKLKYRYPSTNYIARESYMRSHEEVIRRFLRAVVDSIHRVKTQKDYSLRVLKKYTRMDDPEVLTDTYDVYAKRYFQFPPIPGVDEVKAVLDQEAAKNPKAREADPREFINPTYVNELVESGFIKNLQ